MAGGGSNDWRMKLAVKSAAILGWNSDPIAKFCWLWKLALNCSKSQQKRETLPKI